MPHEPSEPHALLSIGELACCGDASVRLIRHYDEHGLLSSARAGNGYRMFLGATVSRARAPEWICAYT
ncbi:MULTISPECIES: MerR family DNA-binding transcriptional regulator [Pseudomonadota]|uniref:MerR family DNA-binding transcriptional regulator n=1 Tax=Bordetella hinzii TaxID=103855 RepID=A0AAN1RVZ1_9BORD|nr:MULTISPECIES: MerR family DNA-binding transcriptional regulator [Pseudomonas]AKQ58399.1 MerR family regulatory protein [Bordetella hinzii]MBU9185902.1 MerR family DNA-binding transcriptional regulator [Burkholderia multivorans]AZW16282.1 MerR family DNA-binding transcriptional regulator [Bordetella hinzii]EIU1680565.1 MerR family DNA-binding transcriptional regulator [Pseudomonas aeruginosa]EKV4465459.1 MerR family DNA-binding transcriptional regulator [Pseudomonas aeruginosa]